MEIGKAQSRFKHDVAGRIKIFQRRRPAGYLPPSVRRHFLRIDIDADGFVFSPGNDKLRHPAPLLSFLAHVGVVIDIAGIQDNRRKQCPQPQTTAEKGKNITAAKHGRQIKVIGLVIIRNDHHLQFENNDGRHQSTTQQHTLAQ